MNALVFRSGSVQVNAAHPEPTIGPGTALVRVIRATLTADDVASTAAHGASSPNPPVSSGAPARVIGQAFLGTVERAEPKPGRDDQKKWIGKRVTSATAIACGACDLCRGGLANHCRSRLAPGVGRDGVACERIAVPIGNLLEVPKRIDDDAGAMTLWLARAIHATQVVRLDGSSLVTILGDGVVAMLAAQVATRVNERVRVLATNDTVVGLCEKWGIKHRPESDAGRRQDQDVVVDFSGDASGFDLATRLVRPRGRIVMGSAFRAGEMRPFPTPPVATDAAGLLAGAMSRIHENEIEVHGARGESFAEALSLLSSGGVDIVPLISSHRRLLECGDAAERLRRPGGFAIAITP